MKSRNFRLNVAEVTAVILTANAATTIDRALQSLPAKMQILVIDACSQDDTQWRARACGARIIERPWTDFVDARRFALAQVTTPWAFSLDADEYCDATLAKSLCDVDGCAAGYELLRDTQYRGRTLHIWRNEILLRVFRVEEVRVEAHPAAGGTAALHERYVVDGPIARLEGHLQHDSYPTAQSYRMKFSRYTQIEAQGVPPSISRLIGELLFSVLRFTRLVLWRGAWRDGVDGITIAASSAIYPCVVQWKALRR